jgi:sugar lactone lactonase YvrE
MTVTENDHIYTVENAIPNKCERVQHFENNGRFLQQWGKEGTANGEFTSPCGIFNDRKGSLFVCDSHRLQQFDYAGKHIQNIPYPKMNKWNWAHGGAVSDNGTLFVCHSQLGLWMYASK